jgi:hypothetical protein
MRCPLLLSALSLLALAGCSGPPPPGGAAATMGTPMQSTPFVWPGIKEPPATPAAEAKLADDEEVIGITVKGRARAYRVAAFKSMTRHVVNDVVNKKAVTVTYCDRADCVRTFTANRDAPLPVMLGGYRGEMLLRVGDEFFEQKSGKSTYSDRVIPYADLPHKRVKWGEWKKAHPDTDVYLGADDEGPDDSPLQKP